MTEADQHPVAVVVITNYNYGRFVADAVRSAAEQTVPCQVIVVDDGSSDDSLTVLQEITNSGEGVQLIAQENGGQAAAMNAGWAAVDPGLDIVLFLDGDDRLHPSAVEDIKRAFDADPNAVRCQFRLQWIDESGTAIAGEFPEPERRLPVGDLRSLVATRPDDIPWQPTSGNAFTADVLSQLMPIPEQGYRISADHYLSNLSPLYGAVLGIEQALGDYRIHGQNHDHRASFDLERLRSILIRTEETRGHLIRRGASLGVEMPDSADGFLSLTTAGMRLISHRLDADTGPGHPFPTDHRPSLIRSGLTAAATRDDFSPVRRLFGGLWILALAVAPKKLVPRIAAQALTR